MEGYSVWSVNIGLTFQGRTRIQFDVRSGRSLQRQELA